MLQSEQELYTEAKATKVPFFLNNGHGFSPQLKLTNSLNQSCACCS